MPGLLDITDDPNTLGLLSLGLRLMSTPGKFGTALGQAGMGALGDLQQARQVTDLRKLREQQAALQKAQEERSQQQFAVSQQLLALQLAQAQAEAAKRQQLSEAAAASQLTQNQVAMAANGGPTVAAADAAPSTAPGFNWKAYQGRVAGIDPVMALQIEASLRKDQPKLKNVETMRTPDGRLANVALFEDGTTKVLPYGVKPDVVLQSLGDKVISVDKNNLSPGASFTIGQSPDSVASNRLGWANYGLAKDRLNFDQTQPKKQYDPDRGVTVDLRTNTATPVMQGGQPMGAKPKDTPVEFKKSVAGLGELENSLKSYEAVLNKHGTGVMSKDAARAELRGAFTAVQMGLKNAMELGALAGPDLDLLNGMLLDPTSPKTMLLGDKGLQQQIDTARDYLSNRGRAVYEAHGQPVPDKYLKVKTWKDAGYASEAAAIQDAQNAILNGADKASVLKRLNDMGITNARIN